MSYRDYNPPAPMLMGYDPYYDLPNDHLARLVETVVEQSLPPKLPDYGPGQPGFDPRLCAKVLVYGYATGLRSSRVLERMCHECLPYLFLTRGAALSYRTLCSFRVNYKDLLEQIWVGLFAVASECGMKRLGRIVVDSTKLRADACPESVVKEVEYEQVLATLRHILQEADETDTDEEFETPGQTQTGKEVKPEQMRDILRRVRKQLSVQKRDKAPEAPDVEAALGPQMRPRIETAIETLENAKASGLKHACLTDPDARMMGEGREKNIRECHSFEVAVDSADGLLVAGQSTPEGNDNARLEPLVEAAKTNEPDGVEAVDGDSGYYAGDQVGRLIEAGLDLCIPDSKTACDLHRGQPIGTTRDKSRGSVDFTYDSEANCYYCPQENRLRFQQERQVCGQWVKIYRAEQACCDCSLASACLTQKNAKHRTFSVGTYEQELKDARRRFTQEEHVQRYQHRGEVVETVFGFIRGTLGFHRWILRGKERVAAEAVLIKNAYQFRKVYMVWKKQMNALAVA